MYFELDNDDRESSKRRSIFISLIFILNFRMKISDIKIRYFKFTVRALDVTCSVT